MKGKILLVNDDAQLRKMLLDSQSTEYKYILLESSAEGLAYLSGNPNQIDLIVMDLDKTVQDQFEIVKYTQNHYLHRNIPILMSASPEQEKDIAYALTMGIDDFLLKPFHMDVIKRRIQNLLELGEKRKVHNVMEDLINEEIEKNIDSLGICPCPKCRKDLLTLTLNHVKPKYVSTETGNAAIKAAQMASINDQIHLLTEITYCAQQIKDNPRHD